MFTNSVRSALRRASTAAISSSTSASVASFERAVVARVARSSPRNYYQIAADRSASASASARASQGVAANAFHASARARFERPAEQDERQQQHGVFEEIVTDRYPVVPDDGRSERARDR